MFKTVHIAHPYRIVALLCPCTRAPRQRCLHRALCTAPRGAATYLEMPLELLLGCPRPRLFVTCQMRNDTVIDREHVFAWSTPCWFGLLRFCQTHIQVSLGGTLHCCLVSGPGLKKLARWGAGTQTVHHHKGARAVD